MSGAQSSTTVVRLRVHTSGFEHTYHWKMFVDGLGADSAVTNGDLRKVDWWVRHAEVRLRNVGLE